MRFAFDVDGMILEMPELFSALTSALRSAGHVVFIVTDFDEHFRDFRIDELKKIGIDYDELIITPNKEAAFKEREIDYAFDDDASYYAGLKCLPLFAAARK